MPGKCWCVPLEVWIANDNWNYGIDVFSTFQLKYMHIITTCHLEMAPECQWNLSESKFSTICFLSNPWALRNVWLTASTLHCEADPMIQQCIICRIAICSMLSQNTLIWCQWCLISPDCYSTKYCQNTVIIQKWMYFSESTSPEFLWITHRCGLYMEDYGTQK